MRLIERLFGIESAKRSAQPDVVFGRYSDAYKSADQLAAFDRSLEIFENGDYLEAYRTFLSSIQDESTENLVVEEKEGVLHFSFWQGSQRIVGTADTEKVRVESKVAVAKDLNVGLLRRLVTANFSLKFCRYALAPDNSLLVKFDTTTTDGSPMKLMYAFKELAIHADKQDDLLLDEFDSLEPAHARLLGEISEAEKEIKYAYTKAQIEQVFAEIDKGQPDPNQYPGTYAYLLLSLAFKLDYLVRPEGFMMDVLEKIHGIYFAKNEKTAQVKVANMRKSYQQLLEREKAVFFKEMYRTKSTFGVNPAVNHGSIVALIEGELPNMEWPLQQNYHALAMAVPQYIAGFALFHYAPPPPDRAFFHLFYQIIEEPFFKHLGFQEQYTDGQGRLDKKNILQGIRQIQEVHRLQYPYLRPDVQRLDFASPVLFSRSYMLMIKDLNLTKVE
ncbi:MAG: hypothetical protein KGS48_04170 [Bacteroidetes bacterium]|nr:hypothetical protein [Bacteroidota bacterium]